MKSKFTKTIIPISCAGDVSPPRSLGSGRALISCLRWENVSLFSSVTVNGTGQEGAEERERETLDTDAALTQRSHRVATRCDSFALRCCSSL